MNAVNRIGGWLSIFCGGLLLVVGTAGAAPDTADRLRGLFEQAARLAPNHPLVCARWRRAVRRGSRAIDAYAAR